jgi:hypothetical protein
VGSYGVTGAGLIANNGNYTFVQAAGNATALTINPVTLTVTANAASRLYGAAEPAFSGSVAGFITGESLGSATTGSEVFSTTALSSSNVGSYGITGAGLTANNGNYVFAQAAGNATALTINPAMLTLTAGNASKTYDGGVTATALAAVGAGTLFGTDTLSGGTFAYTNKNVGIGNKTITATGITVNDGNGGANYSVSYADNTTSTITAANLAVTGVSAGDKIYDGTIAAALTGTAAVIALGSDVVTVGGSGSGTFASADVGVDKPVSVSGFTLGGADAGNYNVVQPFGLTADITALAPIAQAASTAPLPVLNAIAQLESDARSSSSGDAAKIRGLPLVGRCGNAVENNVTCIAGELGPTLHVVDGGMRLQEE